MYRFDYVKPATLDDAVKALGASGEAKLLAGGMTLIPTLKQRLAAPDQLVDLSGLRDLVGVSVNGTTVRIGAMTRHGDVAANADVGRAIPALASLAGQIGDPQVRNRGTIGGSLANNDPAADYPAAVLGLGARVVTTRRGIDGDAFFTGMFETALEHDEIITAVEFVAPKRAAYMKFPNPASRYAVVGVFVAETASGIRVAVTGAAPCVFRWGAAEQALAQTFAPGALDDLSVDVSELNSDMHASAEYRAHLVTVMAKRAVAAVA